MAGTRGLDSSSFQRLAFLSAAARRNAACNIDMLVHIEQFEDYVVYLLSERNEDGSLMYHKITLINHMGVKCASWTRLTLEERAKRRDWMRDAIRNHCARNPAAAQSVTARDYITSEMQQVLLIEYDNLIKRNPYGWSLAYFRSKAFHSLAHSHGIRPSSATLNHNWAKASPLALEELPQLRVKHLYVRGVFVSSDWREIVEKGDYRIKAEAHDHYGVLISSSRPLPQFDQSRFWTSGNVNVCLKEVADRCGFNSSRVTAYGHRRNFVKIFDAVLGTEKTRQLVVHHENYRATVLRKDYRGQNYSDIDTGVALDGDAGSVNTGLVLMDVFAGLYNSADPIMVEIEAHLKCLRTLKSKATSEAASSKDDSEERERKEFNHYMSNVKNRLDQQIDALEAEQKQLQLQVRKSKRADPAKAERLSQIDHHLERHKWHIMKMGIIKGRVDDGKLKIDEVRHLQGDVNYYVDSNQEPDFEEHGGIYDGLNLDDAEIYGLPTENVDRSDANGQQDVENDDDGGFDEIIDTALPTEYSESEYRKLHLKRENRLTVLRNRVNKQKRQQFHLEAELATERHQLEEEEEEERGSPDGDLPTPKTTIEYLSDLIPRLELNKAGKTKCTFCDVVCPSGKTALKHINRHLFVCDVEGCGSTFDYKDSLRRHKESVHKLGVEYVCDDCGYRFTVPLSVRKHQINTCTSTPSNVKTELKTNPKAKPHLLTITSEEGDKENAGDSRARAATKRKTPIPATDDRDSDADSTASQHSIAETSKRSKKKKTSSRQTASQSAKPSKKTTAKPWKKTSTKPSKKTSKRVLSEDDDGVANAEAEPSILSRGRPQRKKRGGGPVNSAEDIVDKMMILSDDSADGDFRAGDANASDSDFE
ncbi:general negative regulator of transcription subunit 5 [Rhizophlyctis rosea]|uniref:General negative regulator of transcription subunit 5 n=1 Tax=Rhizophlyctis rosea TaxID=64517 RepID=A0AAD5SDC3_9FUNG|nr:general negative regulator of transcription subunit 5 [Rhizophlyctis rosea]